MQSFVLDAAENPFNVLAPGKRPRVTLTPTLATKDGLPWLAFAIQGGDGQDQHLLQYFLNIVEFGMTPQEAAEAAVRGWKREHLMQPLRYSINVTLDGSCDHRAILPDQDLHRHAVGNLNRADWNAELVRGDLGTAVQQIKRGPGKGLLVSRREFGSGAVAMRYVPES